MKLTKRHIYILLTALPRWWHRKGFGVQSPSDFSLVRDVLFETCHYYAYEDLHLTTPLQQQLYRIRLWKPDVVVIESAEQYEPIASTANDSTTAVIEHIDDKNAPLWQTILNDPRARITFDMGKRGLILFNSRRIKQNYIL